MTVTHPPSQLRACELPHTALALGRDNQTLVRVGVADVHWESNWQSVGAFVVHGTADPVFSANDTMAWYDALKPADAGAPSYARLFLVPDMNHCAGGPATDRFDMLTALQGNGAGASGRPCRRDAARGGQRPRRATRPDPRGAVSAGARRRGRAVPALNASMTGAQLLYSTPRPLPLT